MNDNLIKQIITESLDESGNVNIQVMNRKWETLQPNKRHRLFWLAATTMCTSAIIQCRKQKYYFSVCNQIVTLERTY